jgi:hypothetical protein
MEEELLSLVGRDDSHESLIQVSSFLPHLLPGPGPRGFTAPSPGSATLQARDAAFLSVRCMILAQTLRRVNMQLLESIRDGSSNPAREHGAVPRVHGEYWGRLHATV